MGSGQGGLVVEGKRSEIGRFFVCRDRENGEYSGNEESTLYAGFIGLYGVYRMYVELSRMYV